MVSRRWIAVGLLALLVPLAPSGTSQIVPGVGDSYVDFELDIPRTFGLVVRTVTGAGPGGTTLSNEIRFPFTLRDNSFDNGAAGSPLYADYTYFVDTSTLPRGWSTLNSTPLLVGSTRGAARPGELIMQVQLGAEEKLAFVDLQVTLTGQSPRSDLKAKHNVTIGAMIFPSPALQLDLVTADVPNGARPNQWVTIPVVIYNPDLYEQKVNLELTIEAAEDEGIDPFLMPVINGGSYQLLPQEKRQVNLSFLTPKAKFWYWGVPVQYTVTVSNSQNSAVGMTATNVLIVDGFYFSRPLLIIIPLVILLAFLFILLLLAAKRYYDERVLGKPIPPWKVPAEAEQLEVLRKTDPKTFYVTRYFLMEEEYASALLWFYSFKRRNKQKIKTEAASARYAEKAASLKNPSLTRFDHRAERLKRRFQRKQERQRLKLEAKLERLQGKLDLHYEEDHDREHKKWEGKVEKLKMKANRPWYREHKAWEKDVAKALAKWEKPFAKEKRDHEKKVQKILAKHEVQVKKKDKQTWKDWREAVENAKQENQLRKKEGREAIPMPELHSKEVKYPALPSPFKTPPKPRLPPEPAALVVKGLPPEPELKKPKLEDSSYAGQTRRARKKTDRKVRRLERKLNRRLARNERDRVRAIAKADRRRRKLSRKSQTVLEPTLMQRVFQQTPEHRERRAHKTLLRSLAKEKLRTVEENERARLEVVEVEAQRREAELMAKLVRGQAEVRRSGAGAAARVEGGPAANQQEALVELRTTNQEKLEKERAKSASRIEAERAQIEKELQSQLAEELIKERLGPEAAAPEAAEAQEPEQSPKKPRRK